jgi:hypothetical protein
MPPLVFFPVVLGILTFPYVQYSPHEPRVKTAVARLGQSRGDESMSMARKIWLGLLTLVVPVIMGSLPASAQQPKPNILFIMGDDIGWMQPSIYHRGLMVGETPNIDRIGNEGAIFMGLRVW